MSTTSSLEFASRRPRYARHFLLTTILTIAMLCAMTLYYGFRELGNTAHDVAAAVTKTIEAEKARGASASSIAQLSLKGFRDAEQIEICFAGDCAVQRAEEGAHVSAGLVNSTGLPCASTNNHISGDRVTVCMAIDELVEDISRDVLVLVIAQSIGFGIWLAASRRFAARRRVWNERVNRATTTDAATGALNRAAFRETLATAASRGDEGWLVMVGIDELKVVNQLHGSRVGDHVIAAVATRLGELEGARSLGRLGGDEFAFLLDGIGHLALERALCRLRAAMQLPIPFDGLMLPVSVCVGAVPLGQGLNTSELKRRATVALRASKKVGADSQSIFSEAYDIDLCKTHQLRLDLMAAVEKGQIELAYQPIVDSHGQLVMAEALARWRHPTLGPVSPDVFISAAESSGVIHTLGIALLKKACGDLVTARARGLALQRIAVNVSPAQLSNPDFAQIVIAVVRDSGLQPVDIELELTESAAMASRQDANQQILDLAAAGFSISIDDFGTGYSSLSRLQTMPIGKLKIDRSFVQACHQASGAVLLEAMIDLSRRLDLICVAEGVETQEQMTWLQSRGCDLLQGYLIGKPMSLDQLLSKDFRASLPSPRLVTPHGTEAAA